MSFVTVRAAADDLGVSDDTVRRYAHLGLIDAERRGPRLLFVDPDSLKREAVGA
jgi:DNA-binding transcriptional MerR regulator